MLSIGLTVTFVAAIVALTLVKPLEMAVRS
jgi:hypothetical protein